MRRIVHIDMDAFFASVEQVDKPYLRGKPVIVGSPPGKRGVVSTCSYEARKFGVHSAMSSSQAFKLCPQGLFVPVSMPLYQAASKKIMKIFLSYTGVVEPLSLDEAYLDVTLNKKGIDSAVQIAKDIKDEIKRTTGLTASAGVSYNKFLAKIGSDWEKPDGLTVINQNDAVEFVSALPVGKFWGVGKVTEARMIKMGLHTGEDLKKLGELGLVNSFGKSGKFLWDILNGVDNRSVNPKRERKSLGKEYTFQTDLFDFSEIQFKVEEIASFVFEILQNKNITGRRVTLKVRYDDFSDITRSFSAENPYTSLTAFLSKINDLLDKNLIRGKGVRLLGVTMGNLVSLEDVISNTEQLYFQFD